MKRLDLTGNTYGYLKVVGFSHIENGNSYFWCECVCGKTVPKQGNLLKGLHIKSCGCLKNTMIAERIFKHGHSFHPLHKIWGNIKHRCYNPNDREYKYYGAKGISVCEEWLVFENFYNWSISNGWKRGLTADRLNPLKGYSPDNCEWVTKKENTTRMHVYRGHNVIGRN